MSNAQTPQLSYAELLAAYDRREAESKADKTRIAELEASKVRQNTVSFKVRAKGEKYQDSTGEDRVGKGGMSMYGVGRFPVTLYASQWRTLLKAAKDGLIDKALEENKAKLSERE
jgi:hypothetical protein